MQASTPSSQKQIFHKKMDKRCVSDTREIFRKYKYSEAQVIFLLETDFNALDKTDFNSRMILTLEQKSVIPCEIIDRRQTQSAIYLVLNKKLLADISNVQKRLMVIICEDTINCYNRVLHLFVSLYTQYFGLEVSYLLVLLRTMKIMKMFLHIFFSMSDRFYSGGDGILF